MSNKTDAAFDLMARKLATHVIRNPGLLWEYQSDVTQLMGHPEVVLAAVLSDGAIVLRCPNGLPADLAEIAEPLEPLDELNALDDQLQQLNRKLDALTADQVEREQILDRMDAVEFALRERQDVQEIYELGKAETAEQLENLIENQRAILQAVTRPSDPDLSPVISTIERATGFIQDTLAERIALAATLDGLIAKVEELGNRPAPLLDITAQRQSFAMFLTSAGTAIARLEATTEALCQLQEDRPSSHATEIAAAFQQIQAQPTVGLDLSAILNRLESLPDLIAESRVDENNAKALSGLAAEVANLAQRPDPILDLTAQRQSFAAFANTLSAVVTRLEGVSAMLGSQRDLPMPYSPELAERLDMITSQTAEGNQHLDTLAKGILQLASLVEHRSNTAISHESEAETRRVLFSVAKDELLQDLRFVFAELIASQMRAQSYAA